MGCRHCRHHLSLLCHSGSPCAFMFERILTHWLEGRDTEMFQLLVRSPNT